ncbi:hypothetical protein R1flu_009882 [Riccia fluitans]|uniref:UDP-glucuronate 4-epimerase n=1 Tax=Riccia fluitans TaxID=41844 RepID=A0ABD1Z3K5_9MARC
MKSKNSNSLPADMYLFDSPKTLLNPLLQHREVVVRSDSHPSTPGKAKMERNNHFGDMQSRSYNFFFVLCVSLFILMAGAYMLRSEGPSVEKKFVVRELENSIPDMWRSQAWQKSIRESSHVKREEGLVVLVTGAAGFVGSHVSLALKKRGDGVVGLDNFNKYYDPQLKRDRQKLLERHGIFIIEGDINDAVLLKELFDMIPFTHVMHLAAQAGVRYALENPNSYVHSNIAGLVTLLEQCRKANPQPAFVWASSSSVYGLNTKVPFAESDRTDQPASLYAATKKAGEEFVHTYNHIYGLSITGLRFFTVYGPFGRPDMAYFSFTQNILSGKPITIYQGPNKVDLARDFTFIDDIVKGCVASLDTAEKSTGTGGKKRGPAQLRTFNLGNTSPVTVPTLVSILEKHLKVKAKKNFVKMPRNGDVPFTHANVTLARNELGYYPTTDLNTGLKKFVKWYQNYYGIATS